VTEQYPQDPQYPQYPQYPGGLVPGPYGGYGPYGGAAQPGPWGALAYGPPPENHLVWAILSTVLCCLPLGIVSIVKSNQVHTLWAQGYDAEARRAADEAKKWAMWSALSLLILVALYVVVMVVMVVAVGSAAVGTSP
jgi:hypothetical protein